MSKLTFRIFTFFVIAAIFTSCSGIEEINITNIGNFQLMGIEENAVTFSADIGVINPSGIGFKVREVDLAATADGIYMGNIKNAAIVKIPAHSDSTYYMVFNMSLSNLLTSAGAIMSISRKSRVNIELQGYIKSTSGLVTKKTDVKEARVVDIPEVGFF